MLLKCRSSDRFQKNLFHSINFKKSGWLLQVQKKTHPTYLKILPSSRLQSLITAYYSPDQLWGENIGKLVFIFQIILIYSVFIIKMMLFSLTSTAVKNLLSIFKLCFIQPLQLLFHIPLHFKTEYLNYFHIFTVNWYKWPSVPEKINFRM